MNIGERIKNRRKELGLSVDDVADKLGKNRATIYRYESSDIENLPITILEPLSKILKTTPDYLMGWIANKEVIRQESTISETEIKLLANYNKLNSIGKSKLLEYSEDLAGNTKYMSQHMGCELAATIEGENDFLRPIAAHNDNIDDEELEKINRDLERLRAKVRANKK